MLRRIIASVTERTGLELERGGADGALARFVQRRLGELALPSLDLYMERLADPAELQLLVDAITVTYTWFWRDSAQLEVLTALARARPASAPPMRIWVPGCATGEDAYTAALLVERAERRVEVLGTDVNTRALAYAQRASYSPWSLREVPDDVRSRFKRETRDGATRYVVPAGVRSFVRFERHNLLDPPPPGEWDLIVCRNVLIYFARGPAARVLVSLAGALASTLEAMPGGTLLLGASDIVVEVPPSLRADYLADKLVFRRSASSPPWVAPRTPSPTPVPPRAPPVVALSGFEAGHAFLRSGDLDRAARAYAEIAEAGPTSGEARLYLGIALHLQGDLTGAARELRSAAFLDRTLWPASVYLGLVYESMGASADALREYRRAVRVGEMRPSATQKGAPLDGWERDLLALAVRRAGIRKAS